MPKKKNITALDPLEAVKRKEKKKGDKKTEMEKEKKKKHEEAAKRAKKERTEELLAMEERRRAALEGRKRHASIFDFLKGVSEGTIVVIPMCLDPPLSDDEKVPPPEPNVPRNSRHGVRPLEPDLMPDILQWGAKEHQANFWPILDSFPSEQ